MPDEEACAVSSADQAATPSALHESSIPQGLVLVSTPIGNLGDVSPRALAALSSAELVLCEDTRVTGKLLAAQGIAARTMALHEHNEDARIPSVLEALR